MAGGMRATLSMMASQARHGIEDVYSDIFALQQQISTGKKVRTVSDDPVVTHESLNIRKSISRNDAYINAIDNVMPNVRLTQNGLDQITEQLRTVRNIGLQAVNSSVDDPAILEGLGTQVNNSFNTLMMLTNSKVGNSYIYAGYNTTSPAFEYDSTNDRVIYRGTDDKITVPVDSNGVTQDTSVSGGEMFHSHKVRGTVGIADPDREFGDLFSTTQTFSFNITVGNDSVQQVIAQPTDTLNTFVAKINEVSGLNAKAYLKEISGEYYLEIHSNIMGADGAMVITDNELDAGNAGLTGIIQKLGIADKDSNMIGTTIEAADAGGLDTIRNMVAMLNSGSVDASTMSGYIQRLDAALDKIVNAHALVGTYDIRLTQTQSLKESLNVDLTALQSQIEDVDFAKVATQLSTKQVAYQAAMQVAVKIMGVSILPYL